MDAVTTTTARPSSAVAVSRVCHGLIAAVVVVSLVIQIALLVTGGTDANSGDSGESLSLGVRLWRLFSYFTIESNLLVLATAFVLALRPAADGRIWRVVRLDALLGILITGVVYDIVLAPMVHLTGAALAATVGFHYISPWAMILAWLVFGPRRRITWGTVAGAFAWPVVWLAYIFTQGAFTDWYPYPFLDVVDLGFGRALFNALVVVVIAIVFAVLFKLVDNRVPALLRDDDR